MTFEIAPFLGLKKLSYRKNLGMINVHCDNFLINAIVQQDNWGKNRDEQSTEITANSR